MFDMQAMGCRKKKIGNFLKCVKATELMVE